LSNGIEALISRITADGPSANRPPHIRLELLPMMRLKSLPLVVPICIGVGCAAALAGCDRQSGGSAQQQEAAAAPTPAPPQAEELTGKIDRSHAGEAVPDLAFADAGGKKLSLAALKGTPVLLNLWATWCAPCKAEMPTLDTIAGDDAGKLRVVTVSQDLKGAAEVTPFFSTQHFAHLEPWLDPDNTLGMKLGGGNAVLPTTVLYDASGKEVWRVVGGYDWASAEARSEIGKVLGG
jgi:thiol-disulfide isomerase/thioredoxin